MTPAVSLTSQTLEPVQAFAETVQATISTPTFSNSAGSVNENALVAGGGPYTVSVVVTIPGAAEGETTTLEQGTDYNLTVNDGTSDVAYNNITAAGRYSVTVTRIDTSTHDFSIPTNTNLSFEVKAAQASTVDISSLTGMTVTFSQAEAMYDGSEFAPTATINGTNAAGNPVSIPVPADKITWSTEENGTYAANMQNAGTYYAKIDLGAGVVADKVTYTGEKTISGAFKITPCAVNKLYVTYKGEPITSNLSIPSTTQNIADNVAVYQTSTSQNALDSSAIAITAENGTITITPAENNTNYQGSVTYKYATDYVIESNDISVSADGKGANLVYGAAPVNPVVVVTNPNAAEQATKPTLVENTDYTVSFLGLDGKEIAKDAIINAGEGYTVVIKAVEGSGYTTDDLEAGATATFNIDKFPLTEENTTVSGIEGFVYTGAEITQPKDLTVTADVNGKKVPLVITGESKDVTVTWPSDPAVKDVSTEEDPYVLSISGVSEGNYSVAENLNFDFAVAPAPIEVGDVAINYGGTAEAPNTSFLLTSANSNSINLADEGNIVVKKDKTPLVYGADQDYTLAIAGTKNTTTVTQPGNVSLVVKGVGNYTGQQTVTVAVRQSIDQANFAWQDAKDPEWTGQPIEREFTLTDANGNPLVEDKDYTVEYKNNTNAGTETASVVITGIGDKWGGTTTKKFSIKGVAATLTNVTIEPATYDGTEKTPKITFTLTEQATGKIITGVKPIIVSEGTSTYVDANTYAITVAVEGKYEVKPVTADFVINPADLATLQIAPVYPVDSPEAFILDSKTNAVKDPVFAVELGGKAVMLTNKDVTIPQITATGNVILEAVANGNYSNSATVAVKVAKDINDLYVPAIEAVTYNGEAQTPEFKVYEDETEDADEIPATSEDGKTEYYTVSWKDNTNAGTGQLVLTGKGEYGGTKTVDFTINKAAATLDFDAPVAIYTGSAVKPEPVVTLKSDVADLTSGKDFTATYGYANNTDAGTATITVNASGAATNNYTFEAVTKDWTITAADIADATYIGETTVEVGKQPKVSLTFNGKTLVAGTDYDVTATPNVSKEGKANLTVTGKGNFQGTKTVEITVGKAPVNPDKPTSTAGWKQNSTGWWYDNGDNSYPTNTWQEINGAWYHFDKSGYMQTGWQSINGAWYYLNKKGQGTEGAMKTGWFNDNGTWYYLNKKGEGTEGKMATGWKQVAGTWYYFNKSGAMQTGWQKVNGAWYYMAASGAMQTGWINLNGTWYYLLQAGEGTEGKMVSNQWKQINGNWFYFYASGAMAANAWVGNYYVDANGYWVR